jgi:hypothetical protein
MERTCPLKEQATELVAPDPNTLERDYSRLQYYGVPAASVSVTHGGAR